MKARSWQGLGSAAGLAAVCFCAGLSCEKNTRTTSAPSPTAEVVPESRPIVTGDGDAVPIATPPPPRALPPKPPGPPKRPKDSWVMFRSAFEDEADAVFEAKWTGGNRLEIETLNISRVTLDLRKLPEGAPQKGPWNLQIDEQGIQITGARGKVLDLVRSTGGVWTVDKK